MKKLNIFIAALMFVNCNHQIDVSNQFIEFVHKGFTTHSYPILLISSKKIYVELDEKQLNALKLEKTMSGDSGTITDQDKELYIKINYRSVVTDEKTFSTIYNFVTLHKEFYTSLEYLKHHPIKESFEVDANGNQEFYVNEKLKNQLVKELISILKLNKSDENIVKEISYLKQDD